MYVSLVYCICFYKFILNYLIIDTVQTELATPGRIQPYQPRGGDVLRCKKYYVWRAFLQLLLKYGVGTTTS